MRKAAVARNQCPGGMPDIHAKVRGTRMGIGLQIFVSSPALFPRSLYKVSERFDTFFTAERQSRMYHLRLLFERERVDDTVSLCGIPHGTLSAFQPGHYTGLADNLDR